MKRVLAAASALFLALTAAPSRAAFPGENGLIVYTTKPAERYDRGGPRYPGSDGNFKLWSRTPSGTRRYLGTGSNAEWSPDGQWLLFEHLGRLMKMRADGSDLTKILDRSYWLHGYSWSPDGTRIVFSSSGASLRTIGADGGAVTLLHDDPDMCEQEPAWSPDGETIAYAAFPLRQPGWLLLPSCAGIRDPTASDIFTIPANGGERTPVTATREIQESQPEWPPMANNDFRPDLIFLSRRVGNRTRSHIDGWNFTIPGVPNQDIRHIWSGRGAVSSAAMSPDGRRMVFAMRPGTEEDGDSELFLIRTDWTHYGLRDESYEQPQARQLTHNRWDDFAPHWGPR